MGRCLKLVFLLMTILSWICSPYPNGSWDAQGQTITRNAKVLEVEAYLTSKSLEFVRLRFPSIPILVTLRVQPLRQDPSAQPRENPDMVLPFHSFAENAPIDVWDDPAKSVHQLLSYIQSIEVRISIPNTLKDESVMELRETLFSNLGLIPGRDRIDFDRKNWIEAAPLASPTPVVHLEIILLVSGLTLIFLGGLYLIATRAAKIAQGKGTGMAQPAPPPPPMPVSVSENRREHSSLQTMQLSDSMKIEERLDGAVDKLISDPGFPELDDMISLEKLAIRQPESLGVLLRFMDKETQDYLFMRSRDPAWLEALSNKDGVPSMETLHFVQKLVYKHRFEANKGWHDFLISLWRLDTNLAAFLQDMGQNEALGTLAWMPTEVSIPAAKRAFPGAWGILLRPDFKPAPLPESQIKILQPQALSIRRYNDPATLLKYEHERGLLKFLKVCTLDVERDIYTAARKDASIRAVRPPFYPIFEVAPEILAEVRRSVPLREWGTALFNIDRTVRGKILNAFTDRERYTIGEILARCDHENISQEIVGTSREVIGRELQKALRKMQDLPVEEQVEKLDSSPPEEGQDHAAA